jgi:hypothetical protein
MKRAAYTKIAKVFLVFSLFALVLLLLMNGLFRRAGTDREPTGELRDKQVFEDYIVKTYRELEGPGAFIEIRYKGKQIYWEKAEVSYTIGTNSVDKGPLIAMGRDITGGSSRW